MRLISITSNDGRRIDFTYRAQSPSPGGYALRTISAHGRTWTYNIEAENPAGSGTGAYSLLKDVTLPDGRTWEYDLEPMRVKAESYDCYRINIGGVDPVEYSVKGPSGLFATYRLELRRFGKSGVPRKDLQTLDRSSLAAVSYTHLTLPTILLV